MPTTTSTDTSTTTTAVANPPAGGDQAFASTNDDNQNPILKTEPWCVVISNHGQIGVVSRHAQQGDATTAAAARTASAAGNEKFVVKKEADLPAYLAEVEAAEL